MMTYDKFPKEKCSKFYQISAEFSQISRLSGSTFHGCGFGRALNTRPAHPREKREERERESEEHVVASFYELFTAVKVSFMCRPQS